LLIPAPTIVSFVEHHTEEVISLIRGVFTEYKAVFDVVGYDSDLLDINKHYKDCGGWFWVLVDDERVVGTSAVRRNKAGCELKRVYLHQSYRGRGLGRVLTERALQWATEAGCNVVVAWSDARFLESHTMYNRLGFERFSERVSGDSEGSLEYGFRRTLGAQSAL